jgi:hypothetical protein
LGKTVTQLQVSLRSLLQGAFGALQLPHGMSKSIKRPCNLSNTSNVSLCNTCNVSEASLQPMQRERSELLTSKKNIMKPQYILTWLGLLLCAPTLLNAQDFMLVEFGVKVNLGASHLVLHETSAAFFDSVAATNATIVFTGDEDLVFFSKNAPISQVELRLNPSNDLFMASGMHITEALRFTAVTNRLILQSNDLLLGDVAQVQGAGPDNFIVTNDIGYVYKDNLGPAHFLFPVADDTVDYNPILVAEFQTPGRYGVRALTNVLADGDTGPPLTTGVADVSWEIVGGTPGERNLMLNAQWEGTDELAFFDRNRCGLAHYGPSSMSWDLLVTDVFPASGSDPYTRERNNVTEIGYFAVGGEALATDGQAEVDVFLGGGYLGSGLMTDALRENGLLPTQEPFTNLGFTQKGFGGGEAVAPGVFSSTGQDAIVDWVLVEVRDGEDHNNIIATRSGLLQRDGDIVDTDGVSPLRLAGLLPSSYYISVQHRNHLGVMTATPLDFSTGNVEFSFLVDPDQAFGSSNGIADLGDGFYGLISGDFDRNGQVQNTDASGLTQTLGSPGYQQGDLDLNGQVQNIDLQLKLSPNLGRGRQF